MADQTNEPNRAPEEVIQSGSDQTGAGVYAHVAGKDFASAADLTTWFDSAEGRAARGLPAEPDPSKPPVDAPTKDVTTETPEKPTEEAPKEGDKAAPDVEKIKANLKEAGGIYADPRYEAAAIEFETKGAISDATKAKVAADFGVSPEVVQNFIDGQLAQRELAATKGDLAATSATAANEKAIADIHKELGGEAEYGKFQAWAGDALSDAEKESYNKALDSDPVAAKVMLGAFKDRYQAAGNGGGPRDVTQEGQPAPTKNDTSGVRPFASKSEHDKAYADPRYRTDEDYRNSVIARDAISQAFG